MPTAIENQASTLDVLAARILDYQHNEAIDGVDLRHIVFDQALYKVSQENGFNYGDLILNADHTDEGYRDLILYLYPSLKPYYARVINPANKSVLVNLLTQVVNNLPTDPNDDGVDNISDKGVPESPQTNSSIESAVMKVLKVYKDLYEVGFELKLPSGILTPEGLLRLENGQSKVVVDALLAGFYKFLGSLIDHCMQVDTYQARVPASQLRNNYIDYDNAEHSETLRHGVTYFPLYQLANLFGILQDGTPIQSWEELSQVLEPEIRRILSNAYNHDASTKQQIVFSKMVDALTTAIVVSEYDIRSHISLRLVFGGTELSESGFRKAYKNHSSWLFYGNGGESPFHISLLSSGVLEVILVFSQAAFNGKPLFAYQAVERLLQRGKRPSLKSMIIGQDTSGKILTQNLATQQASIILIGAGQRSGKGVLTLNLLGTLLAEGAPLVYLDGKPDMSPVLWKLGQKYNIDPAVWDVFDSHGNELGRGAPAGVSLDDSVFGVLMYLKTLQLMMVSASLAAKGFKSPVGGRPFFIFDEALTVQMTLASTWQKVLLLAKDKSSSREVWDWAEWIIRWVESLEADLAAVINSQLPKSGISTVWLMQSMQPTSWNQYAVKGLSGIALNPLKKPVESRLSLKILGRGTADTEYALGSQRVKEDSIIQTRVLSEGGRHFALTGTQKITDMSSITVFKPYLVLNDSTMGSSSVEELLSHLSAEVKQMIAPNGVLDPRAGFEGFAEMLGGGTIRNLRLGREYLEAVMAEVGLNGRYFSVEDYIYDASAESFLTLGSLLKGDFGAESLGDSQSVNYHGSEGTGSSGTESGNKNQTYTDSGSPSTTPRNGNRTNSSARGSKSSRGNENSSRPHESGYAGVYAPQINIPYDRLNERSFRGTFSSFYTIQNISKLLLDEIKKMVGDLGRVESIEITNSGLIVNNIAFRPEFSDGVLKNLPFDIQNRVERGDITELFYFGHLNRFRNLVFLAIDNSRLAEGRLRRELGLSPRTPWSILFTRFKYLREIVIGGRSIKDDREAARYDSDGRGGFDLQEKLRERLGVPLAAVSNSHMEAIFNSRPVKALTSAAGWSFGLKLALVAPALLGPFGLFFSALYGYKALQSIRSSGQVGNDHQRASRCNQQSRRGNSASRGHKR